MAIDSALPVSAQGVGRGERAWLVGGAVALLVCRIFAAVALPVYDDAFITLRYARNLAYGYGLVYQPGEWLLGTTTPGFALLGSLLFLLRLPMPATVVALNIAADVAAYALLAGMMPRPERGVAAPLFAALFAVSPIANRICVGAMEMNVYVLGALAAIRWYGRRRTTAALALAALLYLLRPEAVILVGVLGLLALLRGERRAALTGGAAAAAIVGAVVAALWLVYGQPVPQ